MWFRSGAALRNSLGELLVINSSWYFDSEGIKNAILHFSEWRWMQWRTVEVDSMQMASNGRGFEWKFDVCRSLDSHWHMNLGWSGLQYILMGSWCQLFSTLPINLLDYSASTMSSKLFIYSPSNPLQTSEHLKSKATSSSLMSHKSTQPTSSYVPQRDQKVHNCITCQIKREFSHNCGLYKEETPQRCLRMNIPKRRGERRLSAFEEISAHSPS